MPCCLLTSGEPSCTGEVHTQVPSLAPTVGKVGGAGQWPGLLWARESPSWGPEGGGSWLLRGVWVWGAAWPCLWGPEFHSVSLACHGAQRWTPGQHGVLSPAGQDTRCVRRCTECRAVLCEATGDAVRGRHRRGSPGQHQCQVGLRLQSGEEGAAGVGRPVPLAHPAGVQAWVWYTVTCLGALGVHIHSGCVHSHPGAGRAPDQPTVQGLCWAFH